MASPSTPVHADNPSEKDVKEPTMLDRAKDEVHAATSSPRHDKETHGRSDDIDEDTPADEVKAPGVFERVKEEVEAIIEAIHPKKKILKAQAILKAKIFMSE